MIATLFHYGAFTAHDVRMATAALIAFSAGLLGFLLVKVLAPGFYARQDTATPMRIGVITMGVNIVLSLLLVYPLAHVGLAAAISIAAFVNSALLYRRLRRERVYHPLPGWGLLLARTLLATLAMGLVIYFGAGDLDGWMTAPALERAARLSLWVVAGIVTYLLLIVLLGVRPAQLLLRRQEGAVSDD
jgi:putative peptidoglycan lipid II flippase